MGRPFERVVDWFLGAPEGEPLEKPPSPFFGRNPKSRRGDAPVPPGYDAARGSKCPFRHRPLVRLRCLSVCRCSIRLFVAIGLAPSCDSFWTEPWGGP